MVAKKLTKRQNEILTFIVKHIMDNGTPPTIRDIARKFGFTVKGAYDHILALERKEWISRKSKHARAITILEYPPGFDHLRRQKELANANIRAIPLVGRIAAGSPDAAISNAEDSFIISGDLLSPSDHFALRVKGDSMIDAGIYDGDIVFVRRQSGAKHRDIVVALIEGIEHEATLKRFMRVGNRMVLHPENPNYQDITIDDPSKLQINGVVVGLYRSLK